MPAIKLSGQVSDLQVVPEAYRDKYEKVGDGYVLKEIEIEDVTGLRNTVTATRAERDAALAKLKPFESFDVDGYNTWLADKDNAAAADSKKKGDWDAREAQIKRTNDAALKAKDDQAASLNQALHSEMIDSRARAALAAAGGNQLFLLPHVTPSIAIKEENGTFVARVVDASGAVRVNSAGNPMSIDERISELKADTQFAGAFAASGSGGTGSSSGRTDGKSGSGGKTIKRADFDKLSPWEQSQLVTKEKVVPVD